VEHRCEQKYFINETEQERCEQPATHYCSNCDKEICEDCAATCHNAFACEAYEGLRPADD
jgi:hypothetical protein